MLNLLRRDRRLTSVLKGDRAGAVRELELGDVDNVFVSADLSAATDRILHDHAMALWKGIYP